MRKTTRLGGLTTLTAALERQESAAYVTVSARQSCHLANTFEVAAIECQLG